MTDSSVRTPLVHRGPVVTGQVACFTFFTAFRALPVPQGDYGMFVTVAERRRAGDHLYSEVYESKDPLIHYTLAIGGSLTPCAGWAWKSCGSRRPR